MRKSETEIRIDMPLRRMSSPLPFNLNIINFLSLIVTSNWSPMWVVV